MRVYIQEKSEAREEPKYTAITNNFLLHTTEVGYKSLTNFCVSY